MNEYLSDKTELSVYFGVDPTAPDSDQPKFVLRNVKWDGSLGDIKNRTRGRKVKSTNYYFVLHLERGDYYPEDVSRPPLAVFANLYERVYLYMIVYPDHKEHVALQEMLDKVRGKPRKKKGERLVRHEIRVADLQRLCPSIPILDYLCQTEQ